MILVVDNYDSFTFNLVQLLGTLDADPVVRRNDEIDVAGVRELSPDGVVLSPGPGRPESAGCCCELIRELGGRTPVLGVCLGHQALAAAFGGRVVGAPEVVHGKTAEVRHGGDGLYRDLPDPFRATRYHSLVVERASLPEPLRVDAWSEDGLVMGMRHRELPLFGVQFHPESIATADGPRLLANFVGLCRAGGGPPPC